jgi:TnpA family transposase
MHDKRFNKTKTVLWEYDAIFRSLHLLNFIDDTKMRSHLRRVLNRIEDYHKLCRAISRIGGSKLRGKNTLENEIWNQCSRLIANCIILYNVMILDKLYDEYKKMQDTVSLELLKKISPIR